MLSLLRVAAVGSCAGRGLAWAEQGGTRVIYFTHLEAGELCMLLVYPKAAKDNIPGYILKEIRKEIEDDRS